MRKLVTVLSAAAFAATLLPASAFAAGRHHARTVVDDPDYAYAQAYAAKSARARPVYAAAAVPDPLLYPVGGAIIGAIIGAAVCPPCTVAGSVLTSGGGALIGGGIGAVGGTVVGVAATPHYYVRD